MAKNQKRRPGNAPISFRPSRDVVTILDALRSETPNRSIRELFEEAFRHYHTAGPGGLAVVHEMRRRIDALES